MILETALWRSLLFSYGEHTTGLKTRTPTCKLHPRWFSVHTGHRHYYPCWTLDPKRTKRWPLAWFSSFLFFSFFKKLLSGLLTENTKECPLSLSTMEWILQIKEDLHSLTKHIRTTVGSAPSMHVILLISAWHPESEPALSDLHLPPSESVSTKEWARPHDTWRTRVSWGLASGRDTGDGSSTYS